MPRKIAVLTVGRSDFGRYRPVLRALKEIPSVSVDLLASGNHFDPRFGRTIDEITESGFDWVPGLGIAVDSDAPECIGRVIAEGTQFLTERFASSRPDILVVLGDRYEMLCGANAAIGFNIPIAHIHGGAVTEGAVDELVRHALTKMSHLHFVSTDVYARRVRQMGEEDWRVATVGAPGLDELAALATASQEEISAKAGIDFTRPTLVVSYHPVTLEPTDLGRQVDALLAAVENSGAQAVLTYPNADPGHRTIIESFVAFVARHEGRARLIDNAGTTLFPNLLRWAGALVGNSSAGIVEAASFRLPVVNVGTRQDGKIKPRNVIDCPPDADAILAAIGKALSPDFRVGLADLVNPYGDGHAGVRIAEILRTVPIDDRLLRKKFVDR